MLLMLLSMISLMCWSLLRPFRVHLGKSEYVYMPMCHCCLDTEHHMCKFSLMQQPSISKALCPYIDPCVHQSTAWHASGQSRSWSTASTEKGSGPLQMGETQARPRSSGNGEIKPYYAIILGRHMSMVQQLYMHFVPGYSSSAYQRSNHTDKPER